MLNHQQLKMRVRKDIYDPSTKKDMSAISVVNFRKQQNKMYTEKQNENKNTIYQSLNGPLNEDGRKQLATENK
jgi:hypothetical protein